MNRLLNVKVLLVKPYGETELLKALKSMKNDKFPGNDRITKEFYEFFWDDIKNSLSESIKKSFISGELPTSQKQEING